MFDRIEIDPRRCGGTPVIRGTRIPVAVILDQLAMRETWESILQGYPELKMSIENTEIVPVQAGR
jgi:uncharacterized protein (DUF433 family)